MIAKILSFDNYLTMIIFNLVLLFSVNIISCSSDNNSKKSNSNNLNSNTTFDETGIQKYKNSSKGKNPDLILKPIEIFRITGDPETDEGLDSARFFGAATDIDFDSDGNLYILDMPRCNVKKFDKYGNFLISFGQRGRGPGEFIIPNALAVVMDTVFIADFNTRKFSKFSTKGEFIEFTNITGEMPQYLFSTKSDKFISLVNKFQRVGDDLYLSFYIGLFDTKFDSILAFKGGKRLKLDTTLQTLF